MNMNDRKCRMQPLGTKEYAECIKKLAESIILQCIEDLWDRSSMHGSINFFAKSGFSTCAAIAGMAISDQVKLLNLVTCAISNIRGKQHKRSRHTKNCRLDGSTNRSSFITMRNKSHLFSHILSQHGAY